MRCYPLRINRAGRPALTPASHAAEAPTHGDNHTLAGQPPPCLSGTIRWYRRGTGAAVCDPAKQSGWPVNPIPVAHATHQYLADVV
ncbi:hypothetical protein KCP69_16275 [Salmonella enterica subsp. enterica]|nr:hypothetical protein KCP69_16275 [Salmonella enterica subsp. enterica]